ncbi:phospholipase D/Transphosphatidylase, Phospholipase D-like domain protein [Artemisia annua]|uniref:Phospholipase D/Transphosphatidylase, Phospholipase D-like domain protein n=1 Tax=Artemisia annua TaxID=35608 RepID=A0A2U1NSY9_ARTAN|nr:phospholipase D/Transphosphatidylase, Phospholipase D-like domain protein [Artemisia annua]
MKQTSTTKKHWSSLVILVPLLLTSCNQFVLLAASTTEFDHDEQCKAWLVQSIPTDMPDLELVRGVLDTADVFRWLAGNSTQNLDIMTQMWQLIARPNDSRSADYGYSEENMQSFGSSEGLSVYKSIEDAADRDINIRLLQHTGRYPDNTDEPDGLASGRTNVESVTLLLKNWFGSGFIHAKVWISDSRHVYVGSANNDWKDFTQVAYAPHNLVKEIGIYLVDCPTVAKQLEIYYNNLWTLGTLNYSDYTTNIWDQQSQISRTVPCWSHFVPSKGRCRYITFTSLSGCSSHSRLSYPLLTDPSTFQLSVETPGLNYPNSHPLLSYLSFGPPELLFGNLQTDEQAWVDTIRSVNFGETVRINTMDWLGQSKDSAQVVYWSSLASTVSQVVFSKQAKVKLLVSYMPDFNINTDQYLKSLLDSNKLCSSSPDNHCLGEVEIKYYMIPGYFSSGPAISNGNSTGNTYPGYTRYNQGEIRS